jgi:predicted RNA binding protein YcfA (HicA-like mRNA interferase family)
MARWEKLLARILSGKADANIPFDGLCGLLERLGYQLDRIEGSHHVFIYPGQPEIINIQPGKDGKAKDYQVKRIRQILTKYGQTRTR